MSHDYGRIIVNDDSDRLTVIGASESSVVIPTLLMCSLPLIHPRHLLPPRCLHSLHTRPALPPSLCCISPPLAPPTSSTAFVLRRCRRERSPAAVSNRLAGSRATVLFPIHAQAKAGATCSTVRSPQHYPSASDSFTLRGGDTYILLSSRRGSIWSCLRAGIFQGFGSEWAMMRRSELRERAICPETRDSDFDCEPDDSEWIEVWVINRSE